MGKAIAAICDLIESAVLDGWNATARLIAVLATISALLSTADVDDVVMRVTSAVVGCITERHPVTCLLVDHPPGAAVRPPPARQVPGNADHSKRLRCCLKTNVLTTVIGRLFDTRNSHVGASQKLYQKIVSHLTASATFETLLS